MWESASSTPHGSQRFVARRRRRRRRALIAFIVLLAFALAALITLLRQPNIRIARIQVFGPPSLGSYGGASVDANRSIEAIARAALEGDYFGLIPRDSIFVYPAARIRAGILAAYPDIAAVSLFRDGLTGLSVKLIGRAPVARWCGSAFATSSAQSCYVFDASGYLYAPVATITQTINAFTVYAPLAGDAGKPPVASEVKPFRATIAQANALPPAFDFARQLRALGSPVEAVVVRGDEVDDMLASGTRVTYVLGDEANAFTALTSARADLNLADGSLEYVDLRFNGKVYLKKK